MQCGRIVRIALQQLLGESAGAVRVACRIELPHIAGVVFAPAPPQRCDMPLPSRVPDPAASRSGEAAKRGRSSARNRASASMSAAAADGARHIGVDIVGDPVIQPDRVQDRGAEPADRRPAGKRQHRNALPQRLDRRGTGIVRKRVERDVDLAIRRPGARLRRRVNKFEPSRIRCRVRRSAPSSARGRPARRTARCSASVANLARHAGCAPRRRELLSFNRTVRPK